MIPIQGIQKTTLLDYPGKVASTIFIGGCNFRCPFCHNASVVFCEDNDSTEEDVFTFLEKRKRILDGVCVTGGEPLLQKELPDFLEKIKKLGLSIKLDTNGTSPDRLRRLIEEGLVDDVAMDIKNSPEKYAQTCGVTALRFSDIQQSAELLLSGCVPFEFRTTVVSPLHEASDFEKIGQWLRGSEPYFLQVFADSGDLISGEGLSAPTDEQLHSYLQILQKYIPAAAIRGH